MAFKHLFLCFFTLCIGLVTCLQPLNCRWTGCEGKLRNGDTICQEYGYGQYTNRNDDRDCGFTAEKVECCKIEPLRDGCKWSQRCYGIAYGDGWICQNEYGSLKLKPSGRKVGCNGFAITRYECCP